MKTDDIKRRYMTSSMDAHRTRDGRAALRCALGDAAALCDALARDVAAENRGRGGKGAVTKLGLQLEAVAKRCGDAIWNMRDLVTMPDEPAAEPSKPVTHFDEMAQEGSGV